MPTIDELNGFYRLERRDIFSRLDDREWFIGCISTQYEYEYSRLRLKVQVSRRRVEDAWDFWQDDLYRVREIEFKKKTELDHFKRAGHLTYWLRRCSPVIVVEETETEFENVRKLREFYYRYGCEYISFYIGFRLCRFVEAYRIRDSAARTDSGLMPEDYELDADFIETVSHFLKAKNVSPHALFLIFKSLLFDVKRRSPGGGAAI